MKSLVRIFTLCIGVLVSSTLFAQSNKLTMEIKENKGDCTGVVKQSCYLVKYHNSKDWENFYAPIDNFNYEEGYRYKVLVQRTKKQNVPADAPSYSYRVIKVQSKRKIDGNAKEGRVLVIDVKENLVDCTGVGPMKCMQVKFPGQKEWTYFYSSIEGFTYEEGYLYKLKISESDRVNTPADASSKTYKLIEVLKKQKVNNHNKDKNQATNTQALTFLGKHKWKLIQLNGKTLDENGVFMNFDAKESRVSGNAGCNNFTGGVAIHGEQIVFKQLASTERACLHANVENEVLRILGSNDLRFDIAEQTFNLYQSNKLVAMFAFAPKDK
ncbi:DUF4377 domain-containing protein [Sphingobacterium sp. MYb382]|uniref:DUF4377 domain-containing protein n=1 Tax=Sphingobacterium sp. MYb382 TaxID=2745278 RepID=UPI0030A28E65